MIPLTFTIICGEVVGLGRYNFPRWYGSDQPWLDPRKGCVAEEPFLCPQRTRALQQNELPSGNQTWEWEIPMFNEGF